jgi:hypothetical protein
MPTQGHPPAPASTQALFEQIASIPTLLAAFDRVRANHGCAGADGASIELLVVVLVLVAGGS